MAGEIITRKERELAQLGLATSFDDFDASWMPSGSQYIYASNASGDYGNWLRSLAEGWARPLVRGVKDGEGDVLIRLQPKVSPDGQRISYVSSPPSLIWVVPLGGGAPVRLDKESSDQGSHSWSPDGNWIAYSARRANNIVLAKSSSGGGGTAITLKTGLKLLTPVVWSPAGDMLCYSDGDGLHAMNADGKGDVLLAPGPSLFWAFAIDGKTLYIVRNSIDQHFELVTLDIASKRQINTRALDLPRGRLAGLSLHPDGKRLLTSVIRFDYDIWLLDGLLGASK